MTKVFSLIIAIALSLALLPATVGAEEVTYYARITEFTAVYDGYTQKVEFCVEFDGAIMESEEFLIELYCTVLDPLSEEWVEEQSLNIYQLTYADCLRDGNRLVGTLPLSREEVYLNPGYRDFRLCVSGKTVENTDGVFYTLDSADIPLSPKAEHEGEGVTVTPQVLPARTAVGGYVLLRLSVDDIPATLSDGLTNLGFVLGYDPELVRIEEAYLDAQGENWVFNAAVTEEKLRFEMNGGGVTEDGDLVVTVKFMTLAVGECSFSITELNGGDGYGHSFDIAAPEAVANLSITGNPIQKGDVNGDGAVDNLDASWVLQYDAGIRNSIENGDVNGDGAVNSVDASMILRYDAGMIDSF